MKFPNTRTKEKILNVSRIKKQAAYMVPVMRMTSASQ